jgi:hypothetical protein
LTDKKATPFGDVHSMGPTNAVFSPDGRWVAYQVTENVGVGTRGTTIYVQPFGTAGTKYSITKGGGLQPLWSRDGKSLFYNPSASQLVFVGVTTEPVFSLTNPVSVPKGFSDCGPPCARTYDITPDGQRALAVIESGSTPAGARAGPQIQIVLNWFEELKHRVPTK